MGTKLNTRLNVHLVLMLKILFITIVQESYMKQLLLQIIVHNSKNKPTHH